MSDFAQLVAEARRAGPRLDPSYWRSVCGLGASWMLILSGKVWLGCSYCGDAAALENPPFDVPDMPLDEAEFEAAFLFVAAHDVDFIKGAMMDEPRSHGTLRSPFTGESLTNCVLRAAERRRQIESTTQRTLPAVREPSAEERAAWRATFVAEDRAQRHRREQLADWFDGHERFLFPIDGQQLSGPQCAAFLRAGAPFRPFYCAQGLGWRV